MNALRPFHLTPERIDSLRGQLLRQPEIVSFKSEPELTGMIASIGLCREFGTLNDEMARFVFDPATGKPIPFSELRAELVQYGDTIGVRLWSPKHSRLELRFKGIRELLNPRFSFHQDGTIFQCVFFPKSIAQILHLQNTDLVLVRQWGMNTIFGGFDPAKHFYQTNFWELENNDTLRFAKLLEEHRVPFLGTHDLVAHIAGVRAEAWRSLAAKATQVRRVLGGYFDDVETPTISSLVIPYTVGVLLDDLAQPPNYDAVGRHLVIDEALRAIEARAIDPTQPRVLMRFPKSYERAIRLARDPDLAKVKSEAKAVISQLVAEIQSQSMTLKETGLREDRAALTTDAKKEAGWI